MLRRAGLAGVIVGLDLGEAITTAEAYGAADRAQLAEYLTSIEIAAVIASSRQAKANS